MEARPRRLQLKTRERSRELRRNMTEAGRRLWWAIRSRSVDGARFRRQVPIGDYFADFCCLKRKLVIEVDGGHHSETGECNAAMRDGNWKLVRPAIREFIELDPEDLRMDRHSIRD